MLRVKATKVGQVRGKLKQPGAVFHIPEDKFSERWMEKLGTVAKRKRKPAKKAPAKKASN